MAALSAPDASSDSDDEAHFWPFAEAFEEDGDQLGALPGEAPAAMKNFGNAIEDRHAGAGGGALVKDADGATRRITKVRGHILIRNTFF